MTDVADPGTPRDTGFGEQPKPRELASRACDACRARRRKCVFPRVDGTTASQCVGCSRLHIQCSFAIPTRPRGPKRKRPQPSIPVSPEFQPDSPSDYHRVQDRSSHDDATVSHNAQLGIMSNTPHTNPSPSRSSISVPGVFLAEDESGFYHRPLLTDELCPRELLMSIMTDFTERVYPLVPIVHLPTFHADLAANRDVNDLDFLCLIIALSALTVGLLPSRFDAYHALASRFGTRTAMINYCSQMCLRLRPADYWDHLSHRKWAVAFALSMGVFQTGQTNQSRMFEAESMQIARLLELHRTSEYEDLNAVENQLRKKAFWLQLYTFAHSKIQPGRRNHVTYLDNYMLREVDFDALEPLNLLDENILETGAAGCSPAVLPARLHSNAEDESFNTTSTFIITSRVFLKGMRESMFNDGCDCGFGRTPEERLSRLRDLLDELRYLLDGLPPHLRQWGPGDSYQSPDKPFYNGINDGSIDQDPFGEVHLVHAQNEVTRVNLHVTHLWLQNFLLDRMDGVIQEMDSSRLQPSTAMSHLKLNWREREDICRQLLHILHSIPHPYLEPNGLFLIYKVRDVASSLLSCPLAMDEHVSRRASEFVQEFTKVLSYLDRSEIVNTDGLKSWIDEGRRNDKSI